MDFLDISSLGSAYRYAVKIEEKFQQNNKRYSVPAHPAQKQGNGNPGHKIQDKERTTSPHQKQIRGMGRQRSTLGSGANFIKSLITTLMNVAQRSHWWPNSNLNNHISILILNPIPHPQKMGSISLMQTPLPLLLLHRFN